MKVPLLKNLIICFVSLLSVLVGQLQYVLDLNANDNASPLFLAAQNGHVQCTKLLLEKGADANVMTDEPCALPLLAAVEMGMAE